MAQALDQNIPIILFYASTIRRFPSAVVGRKVDF